MKKLLVLSLFFAWGSWAGPLYTNLGPGDSFAVGATTSLNSQDSFADGTKFTASASGALGDVLVPVANDPNGVLSFALYSDSSGQPGALLESWTNVAVPTLNGSLTTLDSIVHPLLTAGDVYWFTATSAAEPQGHFGLQWNVSDRLTSGGIWQDNFGTWVQDFAGEPPAAIELDSVGAPEPATLALLGCGLLAAAVWKVRKS